MPRSPPPRLGARESAEARTRARRGGAPRRCARRAAQARSAHKAHARKHAEADVGWGWWISASHTRRRVARERRTHVAAELVGVIQRGAPRCTCERAPTPLPCTSASSLWLRSLLLGRWRSGRPTSRRGGRLAARAIARSVGGGFRRAARPARAWIGLLPLSCLPLPSNCLFLPITYHHHPLFCPPLQPPHQALALLAHAGLALGSLALGSRRTGAGLARCACARRALGAGWGARARWVIRQLNRGLLQYRRPKPANCRT